MFSISTYVCIRPSISSIYEHVTTWELIIFREAGYSAGTIENWDSVLDSLVSFVVFEIFFSFSCM